MFRSRALRRRLVAGVGIAALATLTACGSSDDGGGGSEPVADSIADYAPNDTNREAFIAFEEELADKYSGQTLNIMGVNDPWLDSFSEMVEQFEELTGATVNFQGFSYDDTYSREVLVGTDQDSSVDLVMYDLPWVGQFVETGLVEPLDSYIDAVDPDLMMYDDLYEVMREGSTWNDQRYGIPFAPYFIMNISNTSLLDEAGVDGPPETMDEFVQTCHAVTENTGSAGTAINNQTGMAAGQAWFEFVYNMGGRAFESMHPTTEGDYYADMTPRFDTPEARATAEMLKDLISCQPEGAVNITWPERYSSFATGQAAMIAPWNYDIPPLDDPETSTVAGNYVVTPAPVADGVDRVTSVGGWELGINTASTQKEFAFDFITWFSSPAVNAAFVDGGGFPARYSATENADLQAKYPWLEVQGEVVDAAFPAFRPQVPEAFELMTIIGNNLGKYYADEVSLDEALEGAQTELTELLVSAGYTVNE
ncbi:MAG: ABC transporter substrate-binding protein [Beutenbergiaceae bacterium]